MIEYFLPLIILGSLGIILVIIGILIFSSNKKRRQACSQQVEGKVIKYCYPGNQSVGPIAEYYVDGKKYKARKKYRYFTNKVIRRNPGDIDMGNTSICVDENDVFHKTSGGAINYRTLAQEIWPIGSSIQVFYNPEKPKMAYLERVPKKGSIIPPVFISVGLGILALGILITVLFIKFHVFN